MKNTRKQNFQFSKLALGTCYYPEHWDKSLWQSDLQRMKKAGIKTIRIAEFAWNKIETRQNHFDYSFFDEFLDLCEKEDMQVIFGTPTATPPAWLTEKYPEVLNCRMDKVQFKHGMRRHYNYNSPKYQYFCKRIVTKIMQHYGKRKCIIGYQIDNEMNCEIADFYSDADDKAFRKFLKEKYETLENLNKNWGTVFWNQTYTSWKEVHLPQVTIHNSPNPHMLLDYYRFVSASTINFCKIQSDIIRKYKKPEDFVTTNGMFGNLDNHKMMDDCLDLYTYDSYPNFAYCLTEHPECSDDLNDRMWSRNLSETRSICKHFGIMEQQVGAHGWNTRMEAPAPKPGQITLWATQSIAHGADFISFFRWRSAVFGTEMYWHGILNYDNQDNRKLEEITEFGKRVEKLGELTGASYKAKVALLKDYDNIFDSQVDKWHGRNSYPSEKAIFIACEKNHTPLDYVYISDEGSSENLSDYDLIFYPHPIVTDEKIVNQLKSFVENGGTLILGARSGQKMENGQCYMSAMPGPLSQISGTVVEDYTFISNADEDSTIKWNGKEVEAGIFNDILLLSKSNSKILGTYSTNYYKGKPGLVETECGKGKILHFGGTFTQANVKAFLEYTKTAETFGDFIEAPEDVEIAVRENDAAKYVFVLNFDSEEKTVNLHKEGFDMDLQKSVKGKITLKPYESRIFRMEK